MPWRGASRCRRGACVHDLEGNDPLSLRLLPMCFPAPFLGSRNAHKYPQLLDFCKTCPGYPRKRTSPKSVFMSAKCQ